MGLLTKVEDQEESDLMECKKNKSRYKNGVGKKQNKTNKTKQNKTPLFAKANR